MSKATEVAKTGNTLHTDFNTAKIFLRNNRFEKTPFKNTTGGVLEMPGGTLVGRVHATGELFLLKSGAVDGSEIPVGITAEENTSLAAGATIDVNICVAGDVAKEQIIFDGGDDLDTVVDSRTYRDRIPGDTLGIKLVDTDELTGFDNQ